MPKPSDLLQGYTWDAGSGRYRGPTGRYVARTRVLDLLSSSMHDREQRMLRGTTAFVEGRITARTWVSRESTMLKREYLQNAALAAGGWDRLTPRDYGRIGGKLRAEYGRIAAMADQVTAGEVSAAQALNRVRMYQGGARSMYYATERDHLPEAERGMVYLERRVLGPTEDHCTQCPQFYDLGWQYEGTLPIPGSESDCGNNCLCDLLRKQVPANEAENWIGTKG